MPILASEALLYENKKIQCNFNFIQINFQNQKKHEIFSLGYQSNVCCYLWQEVGLMSLLGTVYSRILRGGGGDAVPPGPIFYIFMHFQEKNWPNNRLATPFGIGDPWEMMDLPLMSIIQLALNELYIFQWRICTKKNLDVRPRSNFLHFHAVFGEIWPNNRLAPPPPCIHNIND